MRVAAIYDIHGNLPALEAVLDEIRQAGVDAVVVGGDVMPGPMPLEALTRLLAFELPVHFLRGNGEVAVLEQMAGREPASVPEPVRPMIRWTAQWLDREYERVLASWPRTIRMNIPGLGEVLFCHATPRNENELFTRLTPDGRLLTIFEDIRADVVVCGHTHMQFDRTVSGIRLVNAGSVGMPFGAPGADWLLLGPLSDLSPTDAALRQEFISPGVARRVMATGVEFRHTDYDLQRAAARIRETEYPQAEDFAANHVLQPPTEAQMLALFTRAEPKD